MKPATRIAASSYLLDLPAAVSFSGGRTSGFMLRQILDAHDGQPEDLRVIFCNTGLEHAKTLDFVRDVQENWGVRINWLEYRVDADGEHDHAEVDYDTASRNGEPFTALIQKRGYPPTPVNRICTASLKIRTHARFVRHELGWDDWTNAMGLRYDEPRRVHRMKGDIKAETVVCPMYHAKHSLEHVLGFWKAQPFDLDLPYGNNLFGNCVGCFLKARHKLEMVAEEEPHQFDWWIEQEKAGKPFRQDRPTYAQMLKQVQEQGRLFPADEDTIPCMCTD